MTVTLKKLLERPLETALLIGRESRGASNGATYALLSPATHEVLAQVPDASQDDLEATVSAARAAQKAWTALTAYQRESITRKATAHVRTKADEIGRLMALESGKPFNQSRGEVVASCDTIDYYAAEGVRLEGYSNPTEAANLRSSVIYAPVGVAALIVPWNYPLSLLSWKLGPALAAACSSIVKPSPQTPLCTVAFCRALLEGGLPEGVVNVLTGSSAELGKALVMHRGVDKIAMTGSTATGKRILESVAPQLKKVSLELGGHAPAIVCADADVKNAAKVIAYKGFRNMGQSCSSVNRVYAHERIAVELEAELKALAEKLSVGDGVTDGDPGSSRESRSARQRRRGSRSAARHGRQATAGRRQLLCADGADRRARRRIDDARGNLRTRRADHDLLEPRGSD
jgi:succinate-semialdehyde dehydrogenase / glutarate-semialdehyde dehydrogenase